MTYSSGPEHITGVGRNSSPSTHASRRSHHGRASLSLSLHAELEIELGNHHPTFRQRRAHHGRRGTPHVCPIHGSARPFLVGPPTHAKDPPFYQAPELSGPHAHRLSAALVPRQPPSFLLRSLRRPPFSAAAQKTHRRRRSRAAPLRRIPPLERYPAEHRHVPLPSTAAVNRPPLTVGPANVEDSPTPVSAIQRRRGDRTLQHRSAPTIQLRWRCVDASFPPTGDSPLEDRVPYPPSTITQLRHRTSITGPRRLPESIASPFSSPSITTSHIATDGAEHRATYPHPPPHFSTSPLSVADHCTGTAITTSVPPRTVASVLRSFMPGQPLSTLSPHLCPTTAPARSALVLPERPLCRRIPDCADPFSPWPHSQPHLSSTRLHASLPEITARLHASPPSSDCRPQNQATPSQSRARISPTSPPST